jgi:cytochrome c oxidase assembly protein subunit 11
VTTVASRNTRTARRMAMLALAMLGLAFAAVPLYNIFCAATGFDGTPLRSDKAPGAVAGQIGVRFDANINSGLPWKFEPKQETVRIAPGARTQIFYHATNLTARTTTGRAVFNISPQRAAPYFNKIECFCFTEQTLRGGQSVDMPVVFYVDPRIKDDEDSKDIDEITLSYTFYPVEKGASGS